LKTETFKTYASIEKKRDMDNKNKQCVSIYE
jgi:hypothetical protein